jgi:allantoin racemase
VKIFIINPNADKKFTEMIKVEALKVISPGNEIVCKNAPNAPMFIGNYIDEILCGPGMLQLLRENEKDFDVFVLGCTCDVNIDIMRETTEKPVVGIGESSMLAAMMLGGKFSVIQMGPRGISMKKRFIKNLGFDSRCASVRSIDINGPGDMADKIIVGAQKAIEEDGAEVITLGCAGLAGLAEKVSQEIGIPVIDGIPYGIRFAEALVACGGKTSKKGLYGPSV